MVFDQYTPLNSQNTDPTAYITMLEKIQLLDKETKTNGNREIDILARLVAGLLPHLIGNPSGDF